MKKLAIIIPHRNRQRNLYSLINHLNWFLPRHSIVDYKIFIANQQDDNLFNKGALYNTVFKDINKDYDYFIFHDVDLIALDADYSYVDYPTHISSEVEQFNYINPYDQLFGGVSAFNRQDYITINGFSNKFRGWGGEDDDLFNRILIKGLTPRRKTPGRFLSLWHEVEKNNVYGNNINIMKTNLEIYQQHGIVEGLNTTNCEFKTEELKDTILYRIKT